ncbi:NGF domain-containing protein [Caerostris extrusa]|uniref:NGF domain-containing protein n=1 Tax=Caerostris extrusa TaxID=172846 RepID=A0AAV4PRK2_CAEEX|nr:NGF domain-containing protein [Caerostris extrusa]
MCSNIQTLSHSTIGRRKQIQHSGGPSNTPSLFVPTQFGMITSEMTSSFSNSACRSISDDVQSICRPKKSWVQVYGRTSGDTWRPHWVAVDTACVCSIRKKRFMSLTTGRAPLTGKNFLP